MLPPICLECESDRIHTASLTHLLAYSGTFDSILKSFTVPEIRVQFAHFSVLTVISHTRLTKQTEEAEEDLKVLLKAREKERGSTMSQLAQ